MSIIELNTGDCQNCYKCIRGCPVKAIEFKSSRATVIEDACVLCGACISNCPQNAKYIRNEDVAVQSLLMGDKPVYVSLAPSWSGYFGTKNFQKISYALKKLGFAGVEETAIGAFECSQEYQKLLEKAEMPNIIVTACSSVIMLVERYYPELIDYLAPVSSPMMAHARLMRECYGDIRVVFIGPCYSKKHEAKDRFAGGLVDNVLTFDEIDSMMKNENIDLHHHDKEASGIAQPISRFYPIPGGILKTLDAPQLSSTGAYHAVAVDGLNRCMELFDDICENKLTGYFIEANVCASSCVGGPIMRMNKKSAIVSQSFVSGNRQPQDENIAATAQSPMSHNRIFANRSVRAVMPTEEEIRAILLKTGKVSKDQELNCGSCGYPSCREKAIAVFQGKADIDMCLPFFRERAESISNTILEHSPNAIFAIDSDLMVADLNRTAEEMFGLTRGECIGFPLEMFYEDESFEQAKQFDRPIVQKVEVKRCGIIVEQTVIYIKKHRIFVAFIKDITTNEEGERELETIREQTIETAQKVIEKQMRVAQEIASLLGETTAETKVALTNLKKSMANR